MPVLEWPAEICPRTMKLHLVANTSAFVSPFNRNTQTQELPGQRWEAEVTLPLLIGNKQRIWRAWLAQLRGQAGRFYFGPSASMAGSTGGTISITCDSTLFTCDETWITCDNNGRQFQPPYGDGVYLSGDGTSILTEGWDDRFSPIDVLGVGDFFSVELANGKRSLHLVTEPVEVDSDGLATINFEPPLRSAPAPGAPINYLNPSCIFRLASDAEGAPTYEPGVYANSSVVLIEDF